MQGIRKCNWGGAVRFLFAAALVVGLMPAMALQPAKAYAADGFVTHVSSIEDTITEYGFTQKTRYMEVNGQFAMCCQHFRGTPAEGTPVSTIEAVGNDLMRKVAFYGKYGPADTGQLSLVQTACAMSNANNTDITLTGRDALAKVSGLASPPDSFTVTKWTSGGATQDLITWTYNPYGQIDLEKESSNPDISDNNSCYSRADAVYAVYGSWTDANARSNEQTTLATNNDGYAKSGNVSPGKHFVREKTAPKGFALDETIYEVDVPAGGTVRVNGNKVYDKPQGDPAGSLLSKYDGDKVYDASNLPQGSSSLSLAKYKIKFYGGYYTTEAEAESSGKLMRSWIMQTNEKGITDLRAGDGTFTTKDGKIHPYKVSGDEFYRASNGDITLPMGTVSIQEIEPPKGYLLPNPNPVFLSQITSAGITGENVNTYNMPTIPEPVIRGGVSIQKLDIESMLDTPLGGATLDGAVYEITTLNENTVRVEGKDYAKDQVVKTIVAKNCIATTEADTLPFGKYSIKEVSVGEGYLVSPKVVEFDILDDGVIVEIKGDATIANQVKRGDLKFTKKSDASHTRMANIPFMVTAHTTGESHVLVTDRNGAASTSAEFSKHTNKTNANDKAVTRNEDGSDTVDDALLDDEAGIWFGLTTEGNTTPANDALGALPWDTYDIEELPCAANEGLQLIKEKSVVVTRNNHVVDLGTIDDPQGTIGTTATDAIDGDKVLSVHEDARIIDRVAYANLIPSRTYTITGTVMDKATGKELLVGDKTLTNTATVTPLVQNGYVDVTFDFNTEGLAGKTLVVFETVTLDGRVIAEHKDLEDTDQTLRVVAPSIGTTATDGNDGDKKITTDPETVLVDVVSFDGLVPGKEYTVSGTLMDKETGKPVLSDNKEIKAATTFTPEKVSGTVQVAFKFDSSLLGGKTLVVFESLSHNDKEYATHTDINDEGQTVSVTAPEMGTTAKDGVDGDKTIVTDPEAVLIDTVAYKHLMPGKEYTASGTLMDKETGKPLLLAGEKVEASTKFTPDTPNGYVDVTFKFDASTLAGKTLVVFETLTRNDIEVCSHADINDEGQTVTVVAPTVTTSAKDAIDGDKNVVADKEAKVIDTVAYQNTLPGAKYSLWGILMNKETGLPVISAEGASKVDTKRLSDFTVGLKQAMGLTDAPDNPEDTDPGTDSEETPRGDQEKAATKEKQPRNSILPAPVDTAALSKLMQDYADVAGLISKATYDFTPTSHAGTLDMSYAFDATGLGGKDTVVFEALIKDQSVVALHAEINDAHQTTSVVSSEMGTKATDKTDGDQKLFASKDAVIVDAVSYKHLIAGKAYELKGILMDKNTGKPLLINDKKIEASTTFTPNSAEGMVGLEYAFDATTLAGKKIVVFETLYKDGKEIYAHADINDAAQTVEIIKPPAGTWYDKTGNLLAQHVWLVLALGLVLVASGGYGIYQLREGRKDNFSGTTQ